MLKVAIFTSDDDVWFLGAWEKALEKLSSRYAFSGIYIFPDQVAGRRGFAKFVWCLRVFGWRDCLILGAYAWKRRFFKQGVHTWTGLAKKYGLALNRAADPNTAEVAAWVKRNGIDILLISVSQILKGDILKAPKLGILNKHAALLPSARGALPFFWAIAHGLPLGVSFHLVTERVDDGPLIAQWRYAKRDDASLSLVRYYADVYEAFPAMLEKAMQKWVSGARIPLGAGAGDSYFGWPGKKDMEAFWKCGGRIAEWNDLSYKPGAYFEEVGV